jgi:hypothetical protein
VLFADFHSLNGVGSDRGKVGAASKVVSNHVGGQSSGGQLVR